MPRATLFTLRLRNAEGLDRASPLEEREPDSGRLERGVLQDDVATKAPHPHDVVLEPGSSLCD